MSLLRQLKGYGAYSEEKISAFELWKRVFLDNGNKGNSNYPQVRSYNYYSDGRSIFSGKSNVTNVFSLDGYPKDVSIDYREAIRQEIRGDARVSFISVYEPTKIDWSSAQMTSKLRTWKTLDSDTEDVDEFNYRENISMLDNNTWRKLSLLYLSDAEIRRQRKLFKYRTLMIISGRRGFEYDTTVKEVLSYCKNTGIKASPVLDSIEDYLSYFSPYKQTNSQDILKKVGNITIPDEMAARLSGYDQGKIGLSGDYWGTDITSGFAVFKEVRKNVVDAENILITAETGGGKSYFLKGLILQIVGNPNILGTIMDIEGFEYLPFASYVANSEKVVVLNMAEGQGAYYDPVEIIVTGDKKLDEDMFSFSKSFTLSIMKTLMGKSLASNDWTDVIINDAVSKTYSSRRVSMADMSSWVRSRGLTLFDVYANIKNIYTDIRRVKRVSQDRVLSESQEFKRNDAYKETLDLVVAKLSAYFEPFENGGTRSDVFSKRVTLKDIVDAKLVVCSFGMAGKSADMVDPIQMSLSQLSAANISHVRSVFSQARGKYNFKVWEEFQRWGAFPDSEKTITTALTGGRKLGDINFIVTNNVQSLLDNDKFGVFGNTTSFAIGAIDDSKTRKELCDRLSIPLLKDSLDRIVTRRGDNESFSSEADGGVLGTYDKAFLIRLDKQVSTITKMILPDSISKSSIFRTGDVAGMDML